MKPTAGIKSIEFKWKNCESAFIKHYGDASTKIIPLFSTGGGRIEAWGFPEYYSYQKHFYFSKWCYLTIKGVRRAK